MSATDASLPASQPASQQFDVEQIFSWSHFLHIFRCVRLVHVFASMFCESTNADSERWRRRRQRALACCRIMSGLLALAVYLHTRWHEHWHVSMTAWGMYTIEHANRIPLNIGTKPSLYYLQMTKRNDPILGGCIICICHHQSIIIRWNFFFAFVDERQT